MKSGPAIGLILALPLGRPPARSQNPRMARTAPVSRTIAALGGTVDEVLSDVQVPAFVVDSNGVIAWMNKRATALVGDLRGQQFAAAVMPASLQTARLAFARKILGSVKSTDHEVTLRSASGDPVRGQASSVRSRATRTAWSASSAS